MPAVLELRRVVIGTCGNDISNQSGRTVNAKERRKGVARLNQQLSKRLARCKVVVGRRTRSTSSGIQVVVAVSL